MASRDMCRPCVSSSFANLLMRLWELSKLSIKLPFIWVFARSSSFCSTPLMPICRISRETRSTTRSTSFGLVAAYTVIIPLSEKPLDQQVKLGLLEVPGNRNHSLPRIVMGLDIVQQVLASQPSDGLLFT